MKVASQLFEYVLFFLAIFLVVPTNDFGVTIFQSFNIQAMLLFVVGAMVFYCMRIKSLAHTSFFAAFMLFVQIALSHDYAEASTKEHNFTVLHVNVLQSNKQKGAFAATINQHSPDLISIQELSKSWNQVLLQDLKEEYPYFVLVPKDTSSFGQGMFSKFPLHNVQINEQDSVPTITGEIQIEKKRLHFTSIHTYSPTKLHRFYNRNKQILELAKLYESKPKALPSIVLGDFNAIPWDPVMQKFKQKTGLKDSRKNMAATFPAKFPLIPIDYIFHNDKIVCANMRTVKVKGSDHHALLGKYAFK